MAEVVRYRNFSGTNEDVLHWVWHMEMEATCAGLDHQQLLYKACAHLTSAAASWLDTITLSTWAEFRTALVSRFGEQPELVASKLYSCRQNKNEDVASYADRFQRLTAKLNAASSALPSCILLRLFIEGLSPDIRASVIIKRPETVDQAVEDARYFQEFSPHLQEPVMGTSATTSKQNNRANHQGPASPMQERTNQDRPRPQNYRQQQPQQGPKTWPPRGHDRRSAMKVEDIKRKMEDLQLELTQLGHGGGGPQAYTHTGQMVDLDEADYEEYDAEYSCSEYPTVYHNYMYPTARQPHAWAYAEDIDMPDAVPLAPRRPRQRVSFDPNNLPRATPQSPPPGGQPRGRPTPADQAPNQPRSFPRPQPMRAAPPPRPPTPPGLPPCRAAQSPSAFHITDQLNRTAAKLSIGELLKIAPSVRAEARSMIEHLEAEQQASQANANYAAMESSMPPTCIQQVDECEPIAKQSAYKHKCYDNLADAVAGISVVKAPIKVCNSEITAIVDSGASHTMISELLARKLHLYKQIQPTNAKFYTSAGKLERPVGRLLDIPITVGNLTLPIDVYVSPARTYNLLLGNNFLAAAEAQINFGTKELIYRQDMQNYEAVPLEFIDIENDTKTVTTCSMQPPPEQQENANPQDLSAHLVEGPENKNEQEASAATKPEQDLPPADDDALEVKTQDGQEEAHLGGDETESDDSSGQGITETDSLPEGGEQGSQDANEDLEDWDDSSSSESVWQPDPEQTLVTFSQIDLQDDKETDDYPEDHQQLPQNCLDYIIRAAYGHQVVHLLSDPTQDSQHSPTRDTDDWQFDADLFWEYYDRFGPFSIDACADNQGKNSQLYGAFWCPKDSCLEHAWNGLNVWCNPPWRIIEPILHHFLECKEQQPYDTHAVFVLPNWPWQPWYPTVMQHFDVVDYFPAGSQLFTAPLVDPLHESPLVKAERVSMGPTRWPVMVVMS